MSTIDRARILELLDKIRGRNAYAIAFVRVLAVLGWVGQLLMVLGDNAPFARAQLPVVLAYLGVALALLVVLARFRRARPFGWYALVALDAPALILPFALSLPWSVPRVSVAYAALFSALVLLVFSALEWRQWVIAAATTALFSAVALLHFRAAGKPEELVACALAFVVAGGAGAVLGRAAKRLAETAVHDQLVRERLGRFFSAAVRERILSEDSEGQAPRDYEVTILFADLRDSTKLAHGRSSEQVFQWMDEYLSTLASVVFEHGGTLDKFLGDGLLAYFGAPLESSTNASDAVGCALTMQRRLKSLNGVRTGRGDPPLRVGIGLHSGRATVGVLGPPERREYTLLGDAVNIAARIEGLTKQLGVPVLASAAVRQAAPGFDWLDFDEASIRGTAGRMAVYAPAEDEKRGQATFSA